MPLPMPLAAPVTTAVLPCSLMGTSSGDRGPALRGVLREIDLHAAEAEVERDPFGLRRDFDEDALVVLVLRRADARAQRRTESHGRIEAGEIVEAVEEINRAGRIHLGHAHAADRRRLDGEGVRLALVVERAFARGAAQDQAYL